MNKSIEFIRRLCFLIALVVLAMGAQNAVLAADLPEPTGRVILTISGNIENHNGNGEARFDRAMLESIGLYTLTSKSIYSKNASDWRGILVRDLIKYVGGTTDKVEFAALDDYRAIIPYSDFTKYDVMLAMEKNGEKLTIRSRGPTRIIYPVDQNPELRDQKYAARHVWQIEKIILK